MSSYNMSNPTKGAKVKSVKGAEKHEYAGPIASDSLAAESLRSGGHFAEGNPADISGVSGSKGTFASHPEPGGPHYQEIRPGHKKGDQEVFETGRAGGIDDDLKTKAGRVGTLSGGTLGGGRQSQEAFTGRDAQGRDTTHPISVEHPVRNRGDVEQHRDKREDDDGHPKLGLRGGMAPGEDEGRRGQHGMQSSKYAPSTSTHEVGTVGREEVKQRQTPEWSKIPKDFEPTTNIGSDEDPGRAAEQHFAKTTTRQSKDTNKHETTGEPQTFDRRKDVAMEEGVAATKGTPSARENPYQELNSDETI